MFFLPCTKAKGEWHVTGLGWNTFLRTCCWFNGILERNLKKKSCFYDITSFVTLLPKEKSPTERLEYKRPCLFCFQRITCHEVRWNCKNSTKCLPLHQCKIYIKKKNHFLFWSSSCTMHTSFSCFVFHSQAEVLLQMPIRIILWESWIRLHKCLLYLVQVLAVIHSMVQTSLIVWRCSCRILRQRASSLSEKLAAMPRRTLQSSSNSTTL